MRISNSFIHILTLLYVAAMTISPATGLQGNGQRTLKTTKTKPKRKKSFKKKTVAPTATPTKTPTKKPKSAKAQKTKKPKNAKTSAPSSSPTTLTPSSSPTTVPSSSPTAVPSSSPTNVPSSSPTTSAPTSSPTMWPTPAPIPELQIKFALCVGQCSAADARELEENDAFKLEIAIAAAASTDPPLNPDDFDVELEATAKCDSECGSRRRLDSHGRILLNPGQMDAEMKLRYKKDGEVPEVVAVENAEKNVGKIIVQSSEAIAATLNEDTTLDLGEDGEDIIVVAEDVLATTPAPAPAPIPAPIPDPGTFAPAARTITSPISTDRLTRRNRRSRFLGFVH